MPHPAFSINSLNIHEAVNFNDALGPAEDPTTRQWKSHSARRSFTSPKCLIQFQGRPFRYILRAQKNRCGKNSLACFPVCPDSSRVTSQKPETASLLKERASSNNPTTTTYEIVTQLYPTTSQSVSHNPNTRQPAKTEPLTFSIQPPHGSQRDKSSDSSARTSNTWPPRSSTRGRSTCWCSSRSRRGSSAGSRWGSTARWC